MEAVLTYAGTKLVDHIFGGMGNKHTIEYRTDPAVLELLKTLQGQLAAADQAAKEAKDPALYAQAEKKTFEEFLKRLPDLKLQDVIPRSTAGEVHVAVIGNICAGKSTLLNTLFGLSLSVGLGHTTTGATAVVRDAGNKLVVWDTAGNNQDFNYLDPEQLSLFHSADLVFVLYDNSLRACDKIVRTVAKIKGNRCALIRTKCDMWEADHTNTVDQEITRDRADLAQWGIGTDVKIYRTSKRGGFDNDAVLARMRQGN